MRQFGRLVDILPVKIGANAVVLNDVEEGRMVVGIPGYVVK